MTGTGSGVRGPSRPSDRTTNRGVRVAPARACAHAVLRRVFEQSAWADRALRAEIERHGLDARDRALATRLAYGAVQRRATLDWLIERLAERPVERLDPPVVAALRLGLIQLIAFERIPVHASVGESVALAKQASPRGAGLVNAVLRRAATEAPALVAELPDDTPEAAALKHSHPEWVVRMWWDAHGPDTARALLRAGNEAAEAALRVNTLRADPATLELGVPTRPAGPALPEGLIVDGPFDAHGSPAHAAGAIMPQSRAAMAVARLLDPQPGERVLDLCAAPGGKTTHLAALMGNEGTVVAVERHQGRADALRRTCERMGASCVEVVCADAAGDAVPDGPFDRVLVDPPCTDLGTLAARPDARWRRTEADAQRLAGLQAQLLDAGLRRLAPGGALTYSTCTISPGENEAQIRRVLAMRDDLVLPELPDRLRVWEHAGLRGTIQTLPPRDGTDGFFVARLNRLT